MRHLVILIASMLASGSLLCASPPAPPPGFDVPRLGGITIDGLADDWNGRGFLVALLADPDGRMLAAGDFDARFRLGWNEAGLLVLATIRDDVAREHGELDRLWRLDCVELFAAEAVGSPNRYQLVVASGVDPAQGATRVRIYDHRPEGARQPELTAQWAASAREDGYVVEALLPWKNLGIEPGPAARPAFQFVANDDDGDDASGRSLRAAWYPSHRAHRDPAAMYPLRLSDSPGKPVLLRADREVGQGRCTVRVRGAGEAVGAKVELRSGDEILAEAPLSLLDGRAGARFELPGPAASGHWPAFEVVAGGESLARFDSLPTLERLLERYVEGAGGRAALELLTTRTAGGEYVEELGYRDPPRKVVPLRAWSTAADRWRLDVDGEGRHSRWGCDGEEGWRVHTDGVERRDRLCRSITAFFFDPRAPLRLLDYYPDLVLRGRWSGASGDYFVARATNHNGELNKLYFEEATGLLVQVGGNWQLQQYRRVDGVMLPHRLEMSRKGGWAAYELRSVVHNAALDPARFTVPDLAAVLGDAFAGIDDPRALPVLRRLTREHQGMNVPPRDGRLLHDLVVEQGSKRGLEIGAFNGYSAIWLGLAFRATGGRLITIEYDPEPAEQARENFLRAGLDDVIDLRVADAFEEIPRIEGEFDFIFLDAWKPDYLAFWKMLRDRVAPGGLFTAHNVIEHENHMRDFLETVRGDPEFETTIHETSGAGVSVSVRRRQ